MFRIAILALTLAAFATSTSYACRCRPAPPPKEAMTASLAVFTGKVTETKIEGQHRISKVAVEQSWKGQPKAIVTVRTANNSAACGYNFKADQQYIFYCTGEKDGIWATNTCTRTRTLENAKEDIEALGPGEMPE